MICGGNVKLLLDYVPATPSNAEVFRELRDALQTGEKCYLVADLGKEDDSSRHDRPRPRGRLGGRRLCASERVARLTRRGGGPLDLSGAADSRRPHAS